MPFCVVHSALGRQEYCHPWVHTRQQQMPGCGGAGVGVVCIGAGAVCAGVVAVLLCVVVCVAVVEDCAGAVAPCAVRGRVVCAAAGAANAMSTNRARSERFMAVVPSLDETVTRGKVVTPAGDG